MTVETLSGLAGVVLSLLFAYVPGLADWFAGLESVYKRLIMGAMIVLVAGGAFGLSCAGFMNVAVCDKNGAFNLINAAIAALVANQATYSLMTKK